MINLFDKVFFEYLYIYSVSLTSQFEKISISFLWLAILRKYQYCYLWIPFGQPDQGLDPNYICNISIHIWYLKFVYHVLMSVLRKMRLQNMYKNIFKLIRFCYRLCCKLQNHLMIIFDCNNLINKLYFFVTLKLPHWINIIWHLFVLF